MNVLIDDGKRAVLGDFGLFRIKADTTSRTGDDAIAGSRNWMAPERLLGGSLCKPSDIYAFGMTVFEVRKGPFTICYSAYSAASCTQPRFL